MGKLITLSYNRSDFSAYYEAPYGPGNGAAVILVYSIGGLTQQMKQVSERLCREGYTVLAPDILSGTGIQSQLHTEILRSVYDPDTGQDTANRIRTALSPIQTPDFGQHTLGKLETCQAYLAGYHNIGMSQAVMGFGFGATYAFEYTMRSRSVKAAVIFYGPITADPGNPGMIACPVLAFYGQRDTDLVTAAPAFADVMKRAGKSFEYHIYPGSGDSFFNETNPATYDRAAAEDSWGKTLDFFGRTMPNHTDPVV